MKLGPFTLSRTTGGPATVEDLRALARRRLPAPVLAYLENGADEEVTLGRNREAWRDHRVRQRVLRGVREVDLGVRIAGTHLDLPVVLAPVGLAGAYHGSGDLAAARAARAAGTRSIVSTGATHTLEEVAGEAGGGHWFQLYPWGDRELTGGLLRRASTAGYQALFVTVDVPVVGNRLGERRLGMSVEPVVTPSTAAGYARHPRWLAMQARYRRLSLANLAEPGGPRRIADTVRRQSIAMRPDLDWDDLAWMRDQWDGPMYVKGVLDPEDAALAVRAGADGIVVSNHGGRQLDGTPATADALPGIVAEVGGRAQVLVDGGVRTGHAIAVALALGADAVLIGRPWVYGLAADGQRGVARVLEILDAELRRTLHLMGVRAAADLAGRHLVPHEAPPIPGR
ncbi:alpha-hydroxy acid oxidase [Dietzia aurantiaca]|uniref:Alpha-hydroxy acid oxidase n=1 Tax=Dietzia aurantiaca TaxID=983873 RepID=A0ABV9PLY1_9ACTN